MHYTGDTVKNSAHILASYLLYISKLKSRGEKSKSKSKRAPTAYDSALLTLFRHEWSLLVQDYLIDRLPP